MKVLLRKSDGYLDQIIDSDAFTFLRKLRKQSPQNTAIAYHLSCLLLKKSLPEVDETSWIIYKRLHSHQTVKYLENCHTGLEFNKWLLYVKQLGYDSRTKS
jgi:hypothetical protein